LFRQFVLRVPRLAEQPIREDALLTGLLKPTNRWYGIAKNLRHG
jgi:hypothetical protein